jgi:hypothetical protein
VAPPPFLYLEEGFQVFDRFLLVTIKLSIPAQRGWKRRPKDGELLLLLLLLLLLRTIRFCNYFYFCPLLTSTSLSVLPSFRHQLQLRSSCAFPVTNGTG